MNNRTNTLFTIWLSFSVLVGLNVVTFAILLIRATEMLKVQYVPDDTFYYLLLAKNFSSLGQWTFDSGVSVTSGFHPLLAYLLSGLHKLFQPDSHQFVNYALGLSSFFAFITISVWWLWSLKLRNVYFLMFLALIIHSRAFVYNSISGTEWSLVILISALYGIFFFSRSSYSIKNGGILFIIGFLGSLARSDFALFPFSLFAASALYAFVRPKIMPLTFSFIGLLGSVVGILLIFVHNYIFTNQFLQSSARMKGYWAQFEPPNYYITPLLIGFLIGTTGLFILAFLIITAVLPKFTHKKKSNPASDFSTTENSTLMLFTSTLCIVGYTIVYAHSSAVQIWYTANLITPLLLIIWSVSHYLKHAIHNNYPVWICSIIIFPLLTFNVLSNYPLHPDKAPLSYQQVMLQAGQYLSQHHFSSFVGSWNAGIIGYYGGGQVINLDGLVNNDIYKYAVSNTLPTYLAEKNICHVIDFENMLVDEGLRLRGGYDQSQWIADNLEAVKVFDDGRFLWRYLTLYQVNSPNCTS